MITGSEGGIIPTNDEALLSRMWSYKDHGKSWEAVYDREYPAAVGCLHESFGTNWRMTEMQVAIGRIQLVRMPAWRAKRTANRQAIWRTASKCLGLRVPKVPRHISHGGYKCHVFAEAHHLKADWNRDRILAKGVSSFSGSCSEVYLERCSQEAGLVSEHRLPVARDPGETSLAFLVDPTPTNIEIQKTCDAIKHVMTTAVA
jgi:dTDP-4-amino-4,6-dideoxygalactose transaminase